MIREIKKTIDPSDPVGNHDSLIITPPAEGFFIGGEEMIKPIRNGEEVYEEFYSCISKKNLVEYNYRDMDGELFACVSPTLEIARKKRGSWLATKISNFGEENR